MDKPKKRSGRFVINRNQLWMICVVIIIVMITSLWLRYTPANLSGKLDAVGYAVCHRIPSHSFSLGGRPLPLCARCSGMYLGALFGTLYEMATGKRRGGFSRKTILFLSVFALGFVVDGFNSFLGLILVKSPLYNPQNWLRLITGMGVGLLISALLYPIFTQTAWRSWRSESVFDDRWAIFIVSIGSLFIMAGLLTSIPAILYPLAVLSVAGILFILTLVFSILLLMVFKHENRYNHFYELIPVLMSGLLLTIFQIGLFDLLRYIVTKTWSGLPL